MSFMPLSVPTFVPGSVQDPGLTLYGTDIVTVLVECIASWGMRDLIVICVIYIYVCNILI